MRRLLGLVLLSAVIMPAFGSGPNVIIILADDIGYNNTNFQHLNLLRREGVTFTNGYAAHPLCAPSRAGLITGRHPAKMGIFANHRDDSNPGSDHAHHRENILPIDVDTIADRLRGVGYVSAMIGKWHLGTGDGHRPGDRGFDYSFTPDTLPVFFDRRMRQGYFTQDGEYYTDMVTDKAIDFISAAERPFFLYLSHYAAHVALQAPDEIVSKYAYIRDRNRRVYIAMIRSLDDNIGRLIEALKAAGDFENTMIFFLSDNGGPARGYKTWADNYPVRAGKESVYEGGIRVPFIGVYPGRWPKGVEYDNIVSSLDILPTVLLQAGASIFSLTGLDGMDLTTYILGLHRPYANRRLYWDMRSGSNEMTASRIGRYKFVDDNGVRQSFDLDANIAEDIMLSINTS